MWCVYCVVISVEYPVNEQCTGDGQLKDSGYWFLAGICMDAEVSFPSPLPRLSIMQRAVTTLSVEVKMTPEQYRKRKVALISGK